MHMKQEADLPIEPKTLRLRYAAVHGEHVRGTLSLRPAQLTPNGPQTLRMCLWLQVFGHLRVTGWEPVAHA